MSTAVVSSALAVGLFAQKPPHDVTLGSPVVHTRSIGDLRALLEDGNIWASTNE